MILFFKKILSYFFAIPLEKANGKNSYLELVLINGKQQLSTDEAIYSWQNLYYPFAKSFNALKSELINTKSCLVIGMGMASIPEILNQQMNHQKINYVGIETELIIIDWAKKYVSNTLTQQITWINDDAEKAIYAIKNQFDLICIDVFVHSTVPDFALQINYFEQCKKLLHPNGLLILNVLPNALPLNNNYQQNFELVFKQHKIIPISQNQILVGYN